MVDGVIGSVGFFASESHVDVGYMVHPSAWGNGYATEAVRAAMDAWCDGYGGVRAAMEGLTARKIHALRAETYPGNEPSYRVLQKCGFERVGVERDEGGEFEVWKCERG